MTTGPELLVIGPDSIDAEARAALAAAGWNVRRADAIDGRRPAIILLTADGPVAAIRDRTAAPILLLSDQPADAGANAGASAGLRAGVDAHVPRATPSADLVAILDGWRSDGLMDGFRRLEAMFGPAVVPLLAALRGQIAAALDRPADEGIRDIAHRIAGAAGTLGFADVSHGWAAVSEGDDAAWPDARRHARRALAAMEAAERADP